MSKTQRLKSKKISYSSSQQQQPSPSLAYENTPNQRQRTNIFQNSKAQKPSQPDLYTSQQKQIQLEQYRPLKESNPNGISFTLDAFPISPALDAKCNLPLGFSFSPLIAMQNEQAEVMSKYIDQVPRCGQCKAYMNYYNEVQKGKFKCFLCNSLNYLAEYDPYKQPNNEKKSNIYQALGSPKFYENVAGQECIIFLIDLSRQAYTSQMIHYAVAAMKQVLRNPQFDEHIIQIYGYDQQLYYFQLDEKSTEPKCTIIDKTIQQDIFQNTRKQQKLFKQIREMFFILLDSLPSISEDNINNSNFSHCFDYVYKLTKGLGAKYFIMQANQLLATQPFVSEEYKENANQVTNPIPPKSILQTKNKRFFDRYCSSFINNSNSISMFIFGKGYKNIKVFGDCFKLTNSQLRYYSKDSNQQLQKFYYELSYLLTTTYFKDVYVQFMISDGWRFINVYGNCFRARNANISFFTNHIEASKKFIILLTFSKNVITIPQHCTIQLVINYRYKKQHYTTVVTAVQNITGRLQKIYTGINMQLCVAALARTYLVNLRTEGHAAQNKLQEAASLIYQSALQFYKSNQSFSFEIVYIFSGLLSMRKSIFSQPNRFINTPLFDRMLSQRNYFQFSLITEIGAFFMPFLFDLNNMDQTLCQTQSAQNFLYPPTLQVKFDNVKQGIFLMDSGVLLYLFIARVCDLDLMKNITGLDKIPKNMTITQQMINSQENMQAQQIKNLIKTLRQQKSFGWVPLCIVRSGQNSRNQKSFYMQFYTQKYDQFHYKYSLDEYLKILKNP